ncbi:MAG: putative Dihydrofolate reductase [Promethearchaeota archaeon]|nr:MAG: putative Dihydrofolate reductase [Candidatus Lokiarchaeota archaeon]
MINIIAALSSNHIIGKDGQIPWKLKDDMQNFFSLTAGHTVIMGRKTYESINLPRLPMRQNIVVTQNGEHLKNTGVIWAKNYQESLDLYKCKPQGEVYIIGGYSAYKKFLPKADKMILTFVDTVVCGQNLVKFPKVQWHEWNPISYKTFAKNKDNQHNFTIWNFERF